MSACSTAAKNSALWRPCMNRKIHLLTGITPLHLDWCFLRVHPSTNRQPDVQEDSRRSPEFERVPYTRTSHESSFNESSLQQRSRHTGQRVHHAQDVPPPGSCPRTWQVTPDDVRSWMQAGSPIRVLIKESQESEADRE